MVHPGASFRKKWSQPMEGSQCNKGKKRVGHNSQEHDECQEGSSLREHSQHHQIQFLNQVVSPPGQQSKLQAEAAIWAIGQEMSAPLLQRRFQNLPSHFVCCPHAHTCILLLNLLDSSAFPPPLRPFCAAPASAVACTRMSPVTSHSWHQGAPRPPAQGPAEPAMYPLSTIPQGFR